jgi:glycerol kinase
MRCILALDQGTTSSRAAVVDEQGSILALAQREFPQHFPRPGWVEHDPQDLCDSQMATAIEALQRAGVSREQVAALGLTNQRETTIAWDRKTGRPLHNAIVWQDRRTARQCDELRAAGQQELIRQIAGLEVDSYFSASKAAWLLRHVPQVRAAADAGRLALGTVDSWLIWNLTGGALHVTDTSNASRTMLFDIRAGQWSQSLLKLFGVPAESLPRIVDSSGVIGQVSDPRELRGIPIAGVAGDQQAALMGQLCTAPGQAKCTYGTGCFALMHTGSAPVESRHRLLTTVAWRRAGQMEYALEGSVFDGGSAVQWLRDGLGVIDSASQVSDLAAGVPDSGGVTFVPAFSGLGAPRWDAQARGAILGLTRGTTAAHIARAALEGIAFQVADVLAAMSADAGLGVRELRVDGGAAASDLLMQFQADILQAPLLRPRVLESTALGAAFLAGLAVGCWKEIGDIEANRTAGLRFEPKIPAAQAAELRVRWSQAVDRAGHWAQ